MYNTYPQDSPMDLIRKNRLSVKSFLSTSNALAIAILYTISVVLNFVSSFFSYTAFSELIKTFGDEMGLDIEVASGFSFSIPVLPILTLIAFFLLYSAGQNKNPNTPNSAGATMLMVVAIIELVVFCLAALLILVAIVFAIVIASAGSSSYSSSSLFDFGYINGYIDASVAFLFVILALVIALAFLVLYLIYLIGMIKFSSSLKKGLNTPELTASGAKTVGVCYVFFSIFSGIGMVITFIGSGCSLVATSSIKYGDTTPIIINLILGIVSSAIAFAINVNMARFAFSFNNHVQRDKYQTPSAAPVSHITPPVAPYAYNGPQAAAPVQGMPYEPAPFAPATPQENPYYSEAPVQEPVMAAPSDPVAYQPAPDFGYNNATIAADESQVSFDKAETVALEPEEDSAFVSNTPVTPVAPVCPSCGGNVTEGQIFCTQCGFKLK